MDNVRVAFLASEAVPFVKVGGLGDVAGSLPSALNNLSPILSRGRGLDVRLFLPYHGVIRNTISPVLVDEFTIPSTTGHVPAQIFQYSSEKGILYLISGTPINANDPVYTADNAIDGEKYTFFSVATLKFIQRMKWTPDILHANDWHTAPAVYLLSRKRGTNKFFGKTRSVLTVHNLAYMGNGAESALKHYGIPQSRNEHLPSWAKGQPLPLGLVSADQIVAVSPSYAKEILTPEFGCSLETFLATRQQSISGILNGLDVSCWDPATDKALVSTFTTNKLTRRIENKTALLKLFNLNDDIGTPLLIFVSRMDHQKGIDLVLAGLRKSLHLPWQAILLGTGDPNLEQACRDFQAEHPDRIRAVLKFDPNLARLMYAGGDMLLMPSRYEPCGLVQMIAMRYGCVPIARATGGLRDTIIDVSDPVLSTGFLFEDSNSSALASVMVQAINVYNKKATWKAMKIRGMQTDFSWEKSATQYANTYLSLMEKPL